MIGEDCGHRLLLFNIEYPKLSKVNTALRYKTVRILRILKQCTGKFFSKNTQHTTYSDVRTSKSKELQTHRAVDWT